MVNSNSEMSNKMSKLTIKPTRVPCISVRERNHLFRLFWVECWKFFKNLVKNQRKINHVNFSKFSLKKELNGQNLSSFTKFWVPKMIFWKLTYFISLFQIVDSELCKIFLQTSQNTSL